MNVMSVVVDKFVEDHKNGAVDVSILTMGKFNKRKPDPRKKARAKFEFKKLFGNDIDRETIKPFLSFSNDGTTMELDVPKMLTHYGYPVTEENKDAAVDVLKKVVKELFPITKISVTSAKDN